MIERIGWFDRVFDFGFPAENAGPILERLRGMPARIADRINGIGLEDLVRSDGRGWSIQENVGHLVDLEDLWLGRFDDFDSGQKELRAADLSNQKTIQANHNDRAIVKIQAAFRAKRLAMVERIESKPAEWFSRSALHPRLQTPMRTVDLMFFVAEHDDYHLARISEIIGHFGAAG